MDLITSVDMSTVVNLAFTKTNLRSVINFVNKFFNLSQVDPSKTLRITNKTILLMDHEQAKLITYYFHKI